MRDDRQSWDSWIPRTKNDIEQVDELARLMLDIGRGVGALSKAVKNLRGGRDKAGPVPTWRVRVLNASGLTARVAVASPDETGNLRILGWMTFLPGRESFWVVRQNPFGSFGLIALSADEEIDLFVEQPRRLPVLVPEDGPAPDGMRFLLNGWHGHKEPTVEWSDPAKSCRIEAGCLMQQVDAEGAFAFEIPKLDPGDV